MVTVVSLPEDTTWRSGILVFLNHAVDNAWVQFESSEVNVCIVTAIYPPKRSATAKYKNDMKKLKCSCFFFWLFLRFVLFFFCAHSKLKKVYFMSSSGGGI